MMAFWRSIALPVRFAARDLRGGLAGLRILIACIALGVGAIVGVNSLSRSLGEGLSREGRVILGADASFSLIHRELADDERAFLARRGTLSTIAYLRGMARADRGEATLVEVKAVEPGWPTLGEAKFTPEIRAETALSQQEGVYGAAAEQTLLDRLGLKIGDGLSLGALHLQLRAVLVAEPDQLGAGLGFGPRLLISREALAATDLVQPGSLVRWTTRVLMPGPPSDQAVKEFIAAAKEKFPQAGWETRERSNISPDFSRNLERFAQFLTLAGLASLIVGGVGVANAAQAFIERKRETLAILKTIGASGASAYAVAAIEFLAVSLIGVIAGLIVGAFMPFGIGALFGDLLPFPLAPAIFPGELALGAFYGIMTAFVFSTPGLGKAHDLPVSALFRNLIEPGSSWPRWRYVAMTILAGAALGAGVIGASPQKNVALIAILSIVAGMIILRGVAYGVMSLARAAPRAGPLAWRMALANLHRPGALTASVLSSLGLGLAVLIALGLVDANLRSQLRPAVKSQTPDLYFLDVRSADAGAFHDFLNSQAPEAKIVEAPMMRGRFMRIGDVAVENVKAKESVAWVLEGDRGVTFSAAPPQGAEIVEGQWWGKDYEGPPLVSLEAGIAEGLGLKLGDSVTVNVLGRNITAKIANLRRVNWRSFAINFVLVFSPNSFRGAPYSLLLSAALPAASGPALEAPLVRAVAKSFPGVVSIRVGEALAQIESLAGKLAFAIRSASLIALASSVLVLAGALAASRRARLADAVVLKILGATRRALVGAFLLEYALLGAAASIFALAAGSAAAAAIIVFVMNLEFSFSAGPAVGASLAGLLATVILGMIGAWRILGQRPAAYLRDL